MLSERLAVRTAWRGLWSGRDFGYWASVKSELIGNGVKRVPEKPESVGKGWTEHRDNEYGDQYPNSHGYISSGALIRSNPDSTGLRLFTRGFVVQRWLC